MKPEIIVRNQIEFADYIYNSSWQRPHSGDEDKYRGKWVKKAGNLINGIIIQASTTSELLQEFINERIKNEKP